MKFIITSILILFSQNLSAATPTQLNISRISETYIEAKAFSSIHEHFNHKEHTRHRIIARSIESERSGYYFSVSFNKKINHLPADGKIILEWIPEGKNDVTKKELAIPAINKYSRDLLVGLTGSDWTNRKVKPVAWKISFVDKQGVTFAEKTSFLWSSN
jgi:hypothetical protein